MLGTRYMRGRLTVGWPWYRKLISRGGTLFARTVLLLPYRDLTGGFKAWRRELLDAIRLRETSGSGYGFQIETTWWAHRRGAVILQVPIVFRERVAGARRCPAESSARRCCSSSASALGAIGAALRRRASGATGACGVAGAHRLAWRLARRSPGRRRAA